MPITVNIYPNKREAKVHFSSQKEKDLYLEKEWQFCFKERQDYMSCPPSEIPEKAALYMKRRVAFAKSQNYGPSKVNPEKWVKQEPTSNGVA